MIIQETDFLKTYNEMNNLWEAIESVTINGVDDIHLAKGFQDPDQLIASEPKRASGIYLIEYNSPTDGFQYYVGKSVDLPYRTYVHFNKHPERDSKLLHNKIAAHYTSEPERFKIAILEYNSRDYLCEQEKHWIETLNTYNKTNELGGLNLTRGGEGGNGGKLTPEMYMSIINMLENTEEAEAAIARKHGINRKNVYLINHGWHWLSTSDRAYPIRSEEQNKEFGKRATKTANITNAELPHIVCLDRNNNYYYFPNTTKAAEFAVIHKFYSSERVARDKIKRNIIFVEDLDDFKNKSKNAFIGPGTAQRQLYWGIFKAAPDTSKFKGEPIIDDQGKELGIKLT
jgi:hypothetical protein